MILSYTRVSTDDQAHVLATSLGEQARRNQAIAVLRGAASFDIVLYQDDGVSGSIPLSARPAGKRMLEEAREGDVIVANKMDRLFRSATDALLTAETLAKKKIDLILIDMGTTPVTQNGAAKMFFAIMAAVAEFERERIAERTRDGRRAKKKRNGHIGGSAPYGYRIVGSGRGAVLQEIPEEQEVVQAALSMRRDSRMELHRVVKTLNKRGFRTRNGSEWKPIQVQRFLHWARKQAETDKKHMAADATEREASLTLDPVLETIAAEVPPEPESPAVEPESDLPIVDIAALAREYGVKNG